VRSVIAYGRQGAPDAPSATGSTELLRPARDMHDGGRLGVRVPGTNPLLRYPLELEKIALETTYFVPPRKSLPERRLRARLTLPRRSRDAISDISPVHVRDPAHRRWIARGLGDIDDSDGRRSRVRSRSNPGRGGGLRVLSWAIRRASDRLCSTPSRVATTTESTEITSTTPVVLSTPPHTGGPLAGLQQPIRARRQGGA